MANTKFSITMNEDVKAKMKELAERNHRNLSGEINEAVDFYLGMMGVVDLGDKKPVHKQQKDIITYDFRTHEGDDELYCTRRVDECNDTSGIEVVNNDTSNINSFGNDEVDDI